MLIRIPRYRHRHLPVDESTDFWDCIKRIGGFVDYEEEEDYYDSSDEEVLDDEGDENDEEDEDDWVGRDDQDDEEGSVDDGGVSPKVEAAS